MQGPVQSSGDLRPGQPHLAIVPVMRRPAGPQDQDNTERIRITSHNLESVALALVAEGKGILAADETIPTLTRRFDS
jgi:hypothetical protein